MKTTAQLRHEAPKSRFAATKGKTTTNPLQLQGAEEEQLQMKRNPLQLAAEEEEPLQKRQNPLQLAAAEEEQLQMKRNPLQLAAEEEEQLQMKQNPLQLAAEEEEQLQMKRNPLQLAAEEEEPLQMKQNPLQLAAEEEEPLQMKQTPLQLAAEEEEPLQMKQNPLQLAAEEEEPLQMKQNTLQLAAEEEEPLQMKQNPLQLAAEEEEPLQMKRNPLQLAAEEEEPLQMKQNPLQLEGVESQGSKGENKTGLPDQLKSGVENLSGYTMDDVKVHYNSSQPSQLNALAYAQGTDIHVAPGQEKHLPHEAWHVVQQKQGRVQPTMQLKEGVSVNDDADLENEADVMGQEALNTPAQLKTNLPEGRKAHNWFAPTQLARQHMNAGLPIFSTKLPSNEQSAGPSSLVQRVDQKLPNSHLPLSNTGDISYSNAVTQNRKVVVQREVKQNVNGWGPNKNKWFTTEDPTRFFASEDLAKAREVQVIADRAAAEQARIAEEQAAIANAAAEAAWEQAVWDSAWRFNDAKGRLTEHFNDGWGAAYNIRSEADIANYILSKVNHHGEALGDKRLDLGDFKLLNENVRRPCYILYNAEKIFSVKKGKMEKNTVYRSVYHCGPGNG